MDNRKNPCSAVKRLPHDFMPGYYFFYNSQRAIVVAPLNLPSPKGSPPTKLQEGGSSGPTVHMIGFETNDRGIIRQLAEVYKDYAKLPSDYLAEHSETMDFSDVQAAGDSHDKKFGSIGQELIKQSQERAKAHSSYTPGNTVQLEILFRAMYHQKIEKKPEAGSL